MNKNNIDTFEDDLIDGFEDIEQMLKPQCEFKASEALKEEVLRKAEDEVTPHRSVRVWPWLAAACVAGILVLFMMPPESTDNVVEEKPIIAKVDETPVIGTPKVVETPEHEKIIENIQPRKKTKTTPQVISTPQVIEDKPIEEPIDEPIQMSEETMIELLMAYLTDTGNEQREINHEEEIQQMRIRGDRMISQMKIE